MTSNITLFNANTTNAIPNATYEGEDEAWVYTTLDITSAILFFIGFPGNMTIIYLVSKHQHLKNATNFFVSSLAVADLIVLMSMLFWIIGTKVFDYGMELKYIYSSLDLFGGILSMLNVFCVSADRAIAVTYPLRYERIVTKRRSVVITFAIMCFSLCLLVAGILRVINPLKRDMSYYKDDSYIYHRVVDYICYIMFFVAISGTMLCYTLIFLIVFHKLKGSRKLEKLMSHTRNAFTEDEAPDQPECQERKRSHSILFREIKVTLNILIIVFPFTAGWTFFIGTHLYEDINHTVESVTYNFFMVIIPWLLSVLNPVIYLVVNRSLRQCFCKTVHKLMSQLTFQPRDRPVLDESRLSILASLSRRASSTRTSTTVDGSELINVPLRNVRKSQMTNSARSSSEVC